MRTTNPTGNRLIMGTSNFKSMENSRRLPAIIALALMLGMSMSPILATTSAEDVTEIEVLHTVVNPANNNTYHLLSEASWTDSAIVARSLGGYLVTIDSDEENDWVFDTFAAYGNQTRHLWIGLSDADTDGQYRWHNGEPFYYNAWGEDQPSEGGDEDYVHITGTNMGNIQPGTWNDLENDPQYFPVYGVVEVGDAADYSLSFDGDADYVMTNEGPEFNITDELTISVDVRPYSNEGTQFITMLGDYGFGLYLHNGRIAYADEYSLSKHPITAQGVTVPVDEWSHIDVALTKGVGGGIYLDGALVGEISGEDANIPMGDFGSNDCYQSGEDCDELYIGRAGAACDCYYFSGLIDNLRIDNIDHSKNQGTSNGTDNGSSGSGNETGDNTGNETGNGDDGNHTDPADNSSGGGSTLMFTADDAKGDVNTGVVGPTNATDDILIDITSTGEMDINLSSLTIDVTTENGDVMRCTLGNSDATPGVVGCAITGDTDGVWSVGETLRLVENGLDFANDPNGETLTITITNAETGESLVTISVIAYQEQGVGQSIVSGRSTVNTLSLPNADENTVSLWQFSEGEGILTQDHLTRNATLYGPAWSMPDGTIIAQAIELLNNQNRLFEDISAGETLLLYVDLPEYTRYLSISGWTWDWNWDEQNDAIFDAYVSHESIPTAWKHDEQVDSWFSQLSYYDEWPEEGIWWMTIIFNEDVESFNLNSFWEVAEEPPSLDEMTELVDGIPVTDQSVQYPRRSSDLSGAVNHYYVNVTEELLDLRIKTYGGHGDVDLAISYGGPVDPFGYYGNIDVMYEEGGRQIIDPDFGDGETDPDAKSDESTGPDNDEEVHLYNVPVGIYYVTAYTWENAESFTIVADMTYKPENIDADDAIQLTAGVPYGPMSGYDGLNQYFKIDVPTGTERLEVDLFDGVGQATLYMSLESTPTSADFDYLSNAPGAGDKIGFNDPTPGMWYILLASESVFSNVNIQADFTDRYVWDYDGTPIELFNSEEVAGIQAPEGESYSFFVNIENTAEYLTIETWGGEGDVQLTFDGEILEMDFRFDEEFEGEGWTRVEETRSTWAEGPTQSLTLWFVASGTHDITLKANSDISDITIIASWEESDFIIDDDGGETPVEPAVDTCEDMSHEVMETYDENGDGSITLDEIDATGSDREEFEEADLNSDGELEIAEIIQFLCSCENELELVHMQLDDGRGVSIEKLSSLEWKNEYEFITYDTNTDGRIDWEELELMVLTCETTYDAYDSDGDGVPNDDDAFPEDPEESKDTDGDGVGDNADIAPSISNDLLWSVTGIVLLILVGLLVAFLRGGNNGPGNADWGASQENIAEQMMGMGGDFKPIPDLGTGSAGVTIGAEVDAASVASTPIQPQASMYQPPVQQSTSVDTSGIAADLFDQPPQSVQPVQQAPMQQAPVQQVPQNQQDLADVLDDLF